MSLKDIKNQLNSKLNGDETKKSLMLNEQTLAFDGVKADHLGKLIKVVARQTSLKIELSGELEIVKDKLVFQGTIDWWKTHAKVDGYFALNQSDLELVINITFNGDWHFFDSFPSLASVAGTEQIGQQARETFISSLTFSSPIFVISSFAHRAQDLNVDLCLGLNLILAQKANSLKSIVPSWIDSIGPIKLVGMMSFSKPNDVTPLLENIDSATLVPSHIDLKADIPNVKFTDQIELSDLSINASLVSFSVNSNIEMTTIISIDGNLVIGNTSVNITTVLPSSPDQILQIKAGFDDSLPSFKELIDHFGKGFEHSIPSSINTATSIQVESINVGYHPKQKQLAFVSTELKSNEKWVLLPNIIEIDDIEIKAMLIKQADKSEDDLLSATLSGKLSIRGAIFQVAVKMPDKSLSASLKSGDVRIGDLLNKFIPSAPQISELALNDASLTYDGESEDFNLMLGTDEIWPLPFVHKDKFAILNSKLQITRAKATNNSLFSAQLQGTVVMFGAEFLISAVFTEETPDDLSTDIPKEPQAENSDSGAIKDKKETKKTSWMFSGNTQANSPPINLTQVVNEIISTFGGSLPPEVPEIDIQNIQIGFDSQAGKISFKAETASEIHIPFLSSKNAEVHASFELESAINDITGKRQLCGTMRGDFDIGDSVFHFEYDIGKDKHVVEASWEKSENGNVLGLQTILNAMGVKEKLAVPSKLDLRLKKVFLRYTFETETVEIVADSANRGTLFLIASKLSIGLTEIEPDTEEKELSAEQDESVNIEHVNAKNEQTTNAQDKKEDTNKDSNDADNTLSESQEAKWEFVFGIDFPEKHNFPDDIGVKGLNLHAAKNLSLKSIAILVSSTDIQHFEIPDLPVIKTISNSTSDNQDKKSDTKKTQSKKPVGHGNVIPLNKGFTFIATLDLDSNQSVSGVKALKEVIPHNSLTLTAGLSHSASANNEATENDNSSFIVSAILDGGVSIPTGGSSKLCLDNAGLSFICEDSITIQVFGDLSINLEHKIIDVVPRLALSEEEMEFSVDLAFVDGWHQPMGIKGLTIDELAFEMGITILPAPGVNLGLEGKSHIGDKEKATDSFAFVLEIVEEVPDPLLLSFHIDSLDLKTALMTFSGHSSQAGKGLLEFAEKIEFSDVNFYWAESVVTLPDGNVGQPGFQFSGNLEILGFYAHAAVSIDQSTGMSGEFRSAPIHFHDILSITGNGAGVYSKQDNGKASRLEVIPSKVGKGTDETSTDTVQIVPAGGPVFKFSTASTPYLILSIKATFLNFISEEIEALVTDTNLCFKLKYDVANTVKAEFDFEVEKDSFIATSYFALHIKAKLGPIKVKGVNLGHIHLDTGFDISLDIGGSENDFHFIIKGEFDFEGLRLHFPDLKLSISPKSLDHLPDMIIKHMGENLDKIFVALFEDAGKLIEAGAKEALRLTQEAGKEVVKLADEAEKEATELVVNASKALAHSAEEAAKEVIAIEGKTEKILADGEAEVAQVAKEALEETKKIGEEIGAITNAAEKEVEAIGLEVAQEAEIVAKEVERLGKETAHEIKQIADEAEKEAAQILGDAKKAAREIINVASQAVKAIEKDTKALTNEAKKLARGLAKAGKTIGHAAKHLFHKLHF